MSELSAADQGLSDAAIERLRLAAEEVAWLAGRGYSVTSVSDFVAGHHGLTDAQRAALARGTCSEPQYRRRAARELEAEDVGRRPLAIDATDVLATIEAALRGEPVLQTLDGTARTVVDVGQSYAPGAGLGDAVSRLLQAAADLRPSVIKFILDERASGAAGIRSSIEEQAKARKAKVEIAIVPDAPKVLRKERQIVTGDATLLDVCGGWFNLVGKVLERLPTARIVRLQ